MSIFNFELLIKDPLIYHYNIIFHRVCISMFFGTSNLNNDCSIEISEQISLLKFKFDCQSSGDRCSSPRNWKPFLSKTKH